MACGDGEPKLRHLMPGPTKSLPALCVALGAVLCGCGAGSGDVAPEPSALPETPAPWVSLFDGEDMSDWWVVRGEAECEDGRMVLNPEGDGRTIVVARDLDLRDGVVEVDVARSAEPVPTGPYTISLRLAMSLRWRTIYFVCWPGWLDVSWASFLHKHPTEARRATYDAARRSELWRFEMAGRTIDCYRLGRKLMRFVDPAPAGGSMAITADRCRVEVLDVRYRVRSRGE